MDFNLGDLIYVSTFKDIVLEEKQIFGTSPLNNPYQNPSLSISGVYLYKDIEPNQGIHFLIYRYWIYTVKYGLVWTHYKDSFALIQAA